MPNHAYLGSVMNLADLEARGRLRAHLVDVSDTDAGVTDTTDTVAGAVRAARVNQKDATGRRHRAGSASSSSDPAVRWLLSAWMHREGVVMIYPELAQRSTVYHEVLSSIHGKPDLGKNWTRAEHHARRCSSAIGLLAAQRSEFGARNAPALVVVPASALPGWIAEFSRWAPELNVVEYCGSAVSRHIVQEHDRSMFVTQLFERAL